MLTRRKLFKYGLCATAVLCVGCRSDKSVAEAEEIEPMEARFYKKLSDGSVRCQLCFRECMIGVGRRGFCRVRENKDGTLYSLVYGKAAALVVDPIEKEPMFHNLPGTSILCTGTAGCNFTCKFCQNWHLSQRTPEELAPRTRSISPASVVEMAQRRKSTGLSFTYNEPTIFYEFMYDIAKIGKEKGLNTIFHTNGGMQTEPMRALLEHMAGVTIDLKGFSAGFYKDISFAQMTPVLNNLKLVKEEGKWLEIVNLIIPTLNDDMDDIRQMATWVKENLGSDVPIHFSRFFPAFKMTKLPPTPVSTLERARDIAVNEGMKFVYIGNVPGHKHNSTFCPGCHKRVITRRHFSVFDIDIKDGKCKHCQYPIAGIWEQ